MARHIPPLIPAPIGERIGLLLVLKEVDRINNVRYVQCLCECGNTTVKRLHFLRREGGTRSCGCLVGQFKPRRVATKLSLTTELDSIWNTYKGK